MTIDRRFTARTPRFEPPLAGSAAHVPRRLSDRPRPGPHSGRSPRDRTPAPTAPTDTADVSLFVDRALRLVLEVVDRRRPPRQLTTVLAPPLLGLVSAIAMASVPHRHLGPAVLQRVHIAPMEHTGSTARTGEAAEVFATYARGDRVYAIAARAQRTRRGWLLTALRMS